MVNNHRSTDRRPPISDPELNQLDDGGEEEAVVPDSAIADAPDPAGTLNPWNPILSSTSDGPNLLWNVNQLFRHQFKVKTTESDQESDLDRDAKALIDRFPDRQALGGDMFLARSKELLRRFLLGLETPRFSEAMLDFICSDSTLRIFMRYISRLPEDRSTGEEFQFENQDLLSAQYLDLCGKHQRDFGNLEAQKASYQAMIALCQSNAATNRLYEMKRREIVLHLFNVFQPDSDGNFYHLRQIVQHLLQSDARPFLELVLNPLPKYFKMPSDSHESLSFSKSQQPLILRALPYLKESAVSDMLIDIIFHQNRTRENDDVSEIRLIIFNSLREQGFLECIMDYLSIEDPSEQYKEELTGISDFFVRLIELGVDCKESKLLMGILPKKPELVENLYNLLHSASVPMYQKELLVRVLHAICVKAESVLPRPPSFEQLANKTYNHNPVSSLADISEFCTSLLAKRISEVCWLFTRGFMHPPAAEVLKDEYETFRFSSFKVTHFMTSSRLLFLELFANIFQQVCAETSLLDQVPSTFWGILCDWFFEYPGLLSNHRACMKNMLGKTKLISRLISHFNDKGPSSGARGYIILILNYIRLRGEQMGPDGYIQQLLLSTPNWKEFSPTLKSETERQLQLPLARKFESFAPMPHFGPVKMFSDTSTIDMHHIMKADTLGIDLGSKYAIALGFPPLTVPTKSSENDTENISPVPKTNEDNGTPTTKSSKKKGKKKKSVGGSGYLDAENTPNNVDTE